MSSDVEEGEDMKNMTARVFYAYQNNSQVEQTVQQPSKSSPNIASGVKKNGLDSSENISVGDTEKNSVALKDLSEKYRLIALSTSDLIVFTTFDINPLFTFVSPSHKKLLGYEIEDLLGKPGLDFIHEDDKEHILSILLTYIDAKVNGILTAEMVQNPPKLDFRFRDKSGKWHVLQSTVDIVDDELLFISKDVTEQKRMEEELHESHALFSKAFLSSPEMITITSMNDGRYIDVNESFLRTTGYRRDEIIGHSATELNIWVDPSDRVRFVQGLKNQGSIRNLEVRTRKKTGEIGFVLMSSEIIDIKGEPCALTTTTNISDRKRAELQLQENEKRLNAIIQGLSIAAFFLGNDHKVLYWNKALEELSNIHAEEVIGTSNHWRAFYAEKRPCMADILIDGTIGDVENWYGERFHKSTLLEESYEAADFFPRLGEGGKWLRFTATSIRNTAGDLIGALETLEDISERKRAEDALRKSEEKFVKAFRSSPVAISITRLKDGKFIEINESFEKFFGYSRAELFTQTTIQAGLWFDINDRKRVVEELSKTGSAHDIELRFCTKGGNVKVAHCSAEIIDFNDERCFISVLIDVTEQKKIEESLRENEAKYRGIVENTKDVIILTLPNGTVSYLSPACIEIFGYTPDELLGTLQEIFHPEDRDKVHAVLASALQGKSGTNFEYRILTKQGKLKWISHSWSPIYMDNQKLKYIVSIARDITEPKLFEQNLKEKIEELEQYKNVTVNREIKMLELKEQITELRNKLKEQSK